jgi:hypothetical protein
MADEEKQRLLEEIARRDAVIARLEKENELLRQKLDLVLRKLFGKSAESLDAAQLELLLGEPPGKVPASACGDAPAEAASSVPNSERKPRRVAAHRRGYPDRKRLASRSQTLRLPQGRAGAIARHEEHRRPRRPAARQLASRR